MRPTVLVALLLILVLCLTLGVASLKIDKGDGLLYLEPDDLDNLVDEAEVLEAKKRPGAKSFYGDIVILTRKHEDEREELLTRYSTVPTDEEEEAAGEAQTLFFFNNHHLHPQHPLAIIAARQKQLEQEKKQKEELEKLRASVSDKPSSPKIANMAAPSASETRKAMNSGGKSLTAPSTDSMTSLTRVAAAESVKSSYEKQEQKTQIAQVAKVDANLAIAIELNKTSVQKKSPVASIPVDMGVKFNSNEELVMNMGLSCGPNTPKPSFFGMQVVNCSVSASVQSGTTANSVAVGAKVSATVQVTRNILGTLEVGFKNNVRSVMGRVSISGTSENGGRIFLRDVIPAISNVPIINTIAVQKASISLANDDAFATSDGISSGITISTELDFSIPNPALDELKRAVKLSTQSEALLSTTVAVQLKLQNCTKSLSLANDNSTTSNSTATGCVFTLDVALKNLNMLNGGIACDAFRVTLSNRANPHRLVVAAEKCSIAVPAQQERKPLLTGSLKLAATNITDWALSGTLDQDIPLIPLNNKKNLVSVDKGSNFLASLTEGKLKQLKIVGKVSIARTPIELSADLVQHIYSFELKKPFVLKEVLEFFDRHDLAKAAPEIELSTAKVLLQLPLKGNEEEKKPKQEFGLTIHAGIRAVILNHVLPVNVYLQVKDKAIYVSGTLSKELKLFSLGGSEISLLNPTLKASYNFSDHSVLVGVNGTVKLAIMKYSFGELDAQLMLGTYNNNPAYMVNVAMRTAFNFKAMFPQISPAAADLLDSINMIEPSIRISNFPDPETGEEGIVLMAALNPNKAPKPLEHILSQLRAEAPKLMLVIGAGSTPFDRLRVQLQLGIKYPATPDLFIVFQKLRLYVGLSGSSSLNLGLSAHFQMLIPDDNQKLNLFGAFDFLYSGESVSLQGSAGTESPWKNVFGLQGFNLNRIQFALGLSILATPPYVSPSKVGVVGFLELPDIGEIKISGGIDWGRKSACFEGHIDNIHSGSLVAIMNRIFKFPVHETQVRVPLFQFKNVNARFVPKSCEIGTTVFKPGIHFSADIYIMGQLLVSGEVKATMEGITAKLNIPERRIELGPIKFHAKDSLLDLAITPLEQHFKLKLSYSLDIVIPIFHQTVDVEFTRSGGRFYYKDKLFEVDFHIVLPVSEKALENFNVGTHLSSKEFVKVSLDFRAKLGMINDIMQFFLKGMRQMKYLVEEMRVARERILHDRDRIIKKLNSDALKCNFANEPAPKVVDWHSFWKWVAHAAKKLGSFICSEGVKFAQRFVDFSWTLAHGMVHKAQTIADQLVRIAVPLLDADFTLKEITFRADLARIIEQKRVDKVVLHYLWNKQPRSIEIDVFDSVMNLPKVAASFALKVLTGDQKFKLSVNPDIVSKQQKEYGKLAVRYQKHEFKSVSIEANMLTQLSHEHDKDHVVPMDKYFQ